MSLIDFLEVWWLSVQHFFEVAGVNGRFERSPTNRPKPSCALNLRRGVQEVDLLVWESGEAEFAAIKPDGSTDQHHFDDVRTPSTLSTLLSRCLRLVSSEAID